MREPGLPAVRTSLARRAALLAGLGAILCVAVSSRGEPAPAQRANRLAKETSPYLLLHAHNPVDWYPWGEEALARARRENKLIFLSIGYSTCYWCHVMERESFADPEVAKWLNEHFVCIKVDREERPDIDDVYMTALQVLGRRGGWPLTMFLTPDARPFYGGTYFPPRDKLIELAPGVEAPQAERPRMAGLLTIAGAVQERWTAAPDDIIKAGDQLAAAVRLTLSRQLAAAHPPGAEALEAVKDALAEQYDPEFGGFGYNAADPQRPKFPEPANLVFLLDRARRADDEAARKMLLATLERMAAGGIHDAVGGGFHRYSTDRRWQVPHFEKMLYDNAQLMSVYAEAHRWTGRADFRRVVEGIAQFVDRELSSPGGGFYSALDAETDGHEGAFYVWTTAEIKQALAADQWTLVAEIFGLDGEPNFEGKWVLAQRRQPTDAEWPACQQALRKLLAVRNIRPKLLIDTKLLAGWNGLMIRGLADAGRCLDSPEYVNRAARAVEAILRELRGPGGRLLRTGGNRQTLITAYLDDYAYLVDGLIALHEATGEARWLDQAVELTNRQIELFRDPAGGGFFHTSSEHEELFARSKDPADGALPSAAAVTVSNLVYLAEHAKLPQFHERAEEALRSSAGYLEQVPAAMPRMAVALDQWLRARQR